VTFKFKQELSYCREKASCIWAIIGYTRLQWHS